MTPQALAGAPLRQVAAQEPHQIVTIGYISRGRGRESMKADIRPADRTRRGGISGIDSRRSPMEYQTEQLQGRPTMRWLRSPKAQRPWNSR